MRALLEPRIHLLGVFQQPVLDINFFGLVARECGIETSESAFVMHRLQFLTIQKIRTLVLVAEEKPIPAHRPDGSAFFEKSAERRDASARPDHDYWPLAVRRRAETFVRLHKYGDRCASVGPISEKRRANSLPPASERFVTHCRYREVNLSCADFRAGGN